MSFILMEVKRVNKIYRVFVIVSAVFLLNACFNTSSVDVRRAITPGNITTISSYTPAIEYQGKLLFVSGSIPYSAGAIPAYAVDGIDDIQDQTKIVMDNVNAILAAADYTFDNALKVSVFLSDIKDFTEFNKVYRSYWAEGATFPARETVQVAALPGSKPGAKVLIEVSLIAGK